MPNASSAGAPGRYRRCCSSPIGASSPGRTRRASYPGWPPPGARTLLLLLTAARHARLGLAIPLALFAAALLLARPGEMWFWPAASLAYLPAFAGIGAAALLSIGRGHPAALCAVLLLAAGSVETGAVFVLLFGTRAARPAGRGAALARIGRLARAGDARLGLAPAGAAGRWPAARPGAESRGGDA
ncbi:hypothetical protein [Dankookia sp. P2]|uniref:hypothetical protein n=1 Tax=Dankookia sp. P2 TaxID=3423955 RepID=UPI003D679C31